MIAVPFLLSLVLAADAPPAPKLPLGRDTTYVTGPLDKDGYIDYEAALNDRLAADITPEKNAVVLLCKAFGPTPDGDPLPAEYFRRLGIDAPPKDGDYFIGYRAFTRENLKRDPGDFRVLSDQVERAGKRPWTAKDYPDVAAWLEANEKPLAVVVAATRRPDFYHPLLFQRNDNQQSVPWTVPGCREMGEGLAARAMLRVQQGRFDDAWRDLLACHRLGRLVGRGGAITDSLHGCIIDINACHADVAYLEHAGLTAAQARERMKELQGLPPMAPPADKTDLAERLDFLYEVQFIRRGGVRLFDYLADKAPFPKPDADAAKSLAAIDWAPVLREVNARFDRMAATLRLKDRLERQKALDKIIQESRALKAATSAPWSDVRIILGKDSPEAKAGQLIGDRLMIMLMEVVDSFQFIVDRDEQVHRNVQIAFALAAYHADHGNYPKKLGDLAPQYLAAVPDDLYTGRGLIYRPSDAGYLLYSLGPQGKDEGGRTYDDSPPGGNLRVAVPLPPLPPQK